ncbi:MAG: Hsp20/alpha crystallin family protein [Bacteroidetes bacterium]|nr:Hsp20/alpha crystallin family protein [Bacteroidota bacterium]
MYNAKANYGIMPKTIGGLIEDVFQNGFQNMFSEDAWNETKYVPANIKETDQAYEMQMIAPGLKKEDIKINVDRNILQISYEHKEEKESTGKWIRKEYKLQTFRRSFTLNEKIKTTGISAAYNDGILTIVLPKKEVVEPASQQIAVN